jgi:hypothetical protein
MVGLVIALRELYKHVAYHNRILEILENKPIKGKFQAGRPGLKL